MTIVITRQVSPDMSRCLLTHMERDRIDERLAAAQHAEYVACLRALGAEVVDLPAEPELPDAVFVEDTAFVVEEVAVMTRPASATRRAERASVEAALRPYREIRRIEAGADGATLEGGDILRVGRRVFVGLSTRTNRAGVAALAAILEPLGYEVRAVRVTGCLHLKTAGTHIGDGVVLVNPTWCEADAFDGVDLLEVSPEEPWAGNAVVVRETVIMSRLHERTLARVESIGRQVVTVTASELAKAEGGLTCCSLILDGPRAD